MSLQLQECLIAQPSKVGIAGYHFQCFSQRKGCGQIVGARLGGAEAGSGKWNRCLGFIIHTLGRDFPCMFCTNPSSDDYPIKLFDM